MNDHSGIYVCEAAREDIVHHEAAWVMKLPGRVPQFLSVRAVEDEGAWRYASAIFSRGELWCASTSEWPREAASDTYELGERILSDIASDVAPELAYERIPHKLLEEVVTEHDANALIALAIAVDWLPDEVTADEVSDHIRMNADIDMAERTGQVMPDQDAPASTVLQARDTGDARVVNWQMGSIEELENDARLASEAESASGRVMVNKKNRER